MSNIHPTATVSAKAEIDTDVKIGAYSLVEDHVEIGLGTVIGPQCIIHPYVKLGSENQLHAQVVLGGIPQDISFSGEETWVEIGDQNIIRENCTVHRSTNPQKPTRIGSNCFLMSYCHVAHDCQLGNEVTMASYAGLSGHVEVGDKANIGGHTGTHQFVRIGTLSMVAGFLGVNKDVMPYCLLGREPIKHYRLNTIGLRRAGIKGERYKKLELAYRQLREGKPIDKSESTPEVNYLREWMKASSKRGVYGFLST